MVEKAKIEVLEGSAKGDIDVMFNPTDYTVTKEVKKTGSGSRIQFKEVDMAEFTVKLLFDTYEKQSDVREITEKIASLVKPTFEGRHIKRPPKCVYVWGNFSYTGIVSRVVQKFTMFLGTGVPVRAELTVTFSSALLKEEAEQVSSTKQSRKLWTVKSGERLDLIAYIELKDPAQWRRIAKANKITDPLAFPGDDDIGRLLIIPD